MAKYLSGNLSKIDVKLNIESVQLNMLQHGEKMNCLKSFIICKRYTTNNPPSPVCCGVDVFI